MPLHHQMNDTQAYELLSTLPAYQVEKVLNLLGIVMVAFTVELIRSLDQGT